MGEVVGAVVLLLARATARLASACAPGLRGAAAAAVLAASQVLNDAGRQIDDRTFHLVLSGGDLVGGLLQGGKTR
jgi:hypothetical protein